MIHESKSDDRYRRDILGYVTHPRLNGRPLELLSELLHLLTTGAIRAGELDRITHCAKNTNLENALELAKFSAEVLKNKRKSRAAKRGIKGLS